MRERSPHFPCLWRSLRRGRNRPFLTLAIAVSALAAAIAGCGIGGNRESGAAGLTVTREFGQRELVTASEDPIPAGETVMRLLQRRARVDTRYGGRFVNGVNGVGSRSAGGRRQDWFYYVNGIESPVGAAERRVRGGDHIWWDYRDWGAAMRVPAVVGSFPEPFLHGSGGKRYPLRVDCDEETRSVCDEVMRKLNRADLTPSSAALGTLAGKDTLRVLVGRWAEVRRDAAARQLESGPKTSGVFATIVPRSGGFEMDLLDPLGQIRAKARAGIGLVAATRFEEQQPTWVVTGLDTAGVALAAGLLEAPSLRNRFAVARTKANVVPLPVGGAGNGR